MTIAREHITGVLLAGGQSRRMFEQAGAAGQPKAGDKGLLDIAGRPMLGHVVARLGPQVGRMVVNANGDPARFAAFGLPVVADTVAGFVGPLAGVLAGMRWSAANAHHASHIATVSTDAPFIPADLVSRLAAALAPPSAAVTDGRAGRDAGPGDVGLATAPQAGRDRSPLRIALAQSGDELHPVIGLWPVALADDLEAALTSGMRKVLHWTDRHGTVPVPFEPVTIGAERVDPFFNANTPAELELARRLLGS